jgi:hypothetical protein
MQQSAGTRVLLRRVPGIVVSLVLPVFLVLRLAGAVDWSWWWVLSPLWISALAFLLAGALAATAFTLVRWAVRAWVWLHFRRSLLPELSLADPAMWDRIEAERPVAREPEGAEPGS